MQDSIFTKIIQGEIPAHKVYEDEYVLAFLDIHPSQPGHTLVVPKQQVDHIWDLSDDDYRMLMAAVKKIGRHLETVFEPKRVGVIIAGIGVPHAHVHLIPFSTEAELKAPQALNSESDHATLATMAVKISLGDNT
jgi:histidine triad (HIT) family protein